MPEITFRVEASRLTATLDELPAAVRAAIERALGPVANEVAADARSLAEAHIRYFGQKPGQYLASIYGGTFTRGDRVGGYVRSGSPLAHLLEFGATIPPHDILPSAADVLAFDDVGAVFARHVHSPGGVIPPYPAIEPAFTSHAAEIRDAIEGAAKQAVR